MSGSWVGQRCSLRCLWGRASGRSGGFLGGSPATLWSSLHHTVANGRGLAAGHGDCPWFGLRCRVGPGIAASAVSPGDLQSAASADLTNHPLANSNWSGASGDLWVYLPGLGLWATILSNTWVNLSHHPRACSWARTSLRSPLGWCTWCKSPHHETGPCSSFRSSHGTPTPSEPEVRRHSSSCGCHHWWCYRRLAVPSWCCPQWSCLTSERFRSVASGGWGSGGCGAKPCSQGRHRWPAQGSPKGAKQRGSGGWEALLSPSREARRPWLQSTWPLRCCNWGSSGQLKPAAKHGRHGISGVSMTAPNTICHLEVHLPQCFTDKICLQRLFSNIGTIVIDLHRCCVHFKWTNMHQASKAAPISNLGRHHLHETSRKQHNLKLETKKDRWHGSTTCLSKNGLDQTVIVQVTLAVPNWSSCCVDSTWNMIKPIEICCADFQSNRFKPFQT